MTNTVLPTNNPAVEDIKDLARKLNELMGDDKDKTDVVELPPVDDENADPVGDGSDQDSDKDDGKHLTKVKTFLINYRCRLEYKIKLDDRRLA